MPKYVALNNQKVTFAVCGAGHIGKRHAEMIVKNQQAHLAAIIDTNTSLKEELSKLYHEVPFFSSLENFLDSRQAVKVAKKELKWQKRVAAQI